MEISDALPGADLIRAGFADLANGIESKESLLVLIGAPRLQEDEDSAHSRYNALIR